MGAKMKSKLLAVMVAVVMLMTSAVGVFAGTLSSESGTSYSTTSTASVSNGTLTVDTDGTVTATVNGKEATVKDGTITGLSKGDLVVIKTSDETLYRYFNNTKVSKTKATGNGKVKVTVKKDSKASYYVVKAKKGSKTVYQKLTKKQLSKTLKLGKGTWKISVRPMKKSGGKAYVGVWSKAKSVKVK